MKTMKRKRLAPRNALGAAARFRSGAGAHGKTEKAARRAANIEMRGVAQGQSSGLLTRRREFDPLRLDHQASNPKQAASGLRLEQRN